MLYAVLKIKPLTLILSLPIQHDTDMFIFLASLIKLGDVGVLQLAAHVGATIEFQPHPLPMKIRAKKVPADETAVFNHTFIQTGEIQSHLKPVAVVVEQDARSHRQQMNNSSPGARQRLWIWVLFCRLGD